ncbi:MAG: hypothetical protein HY211_05870 [Candidatus Omnitrophica bacterium]|nr:hypothetical protein [Candidatus Omnitrophota bacterium]
MSIRTTVVGSYPKVIEGSSDNLPGTIDRWQKKSVPDEALEQELQKVIRRVIQEQEGAELDLITDGQVRWEDLAHPIARSARGLNRGALRRFFDNNVYYRRLESNGGLQWQKSSTAEEFQFASKAAKKPIKVALPGPLTLVTFTEISKGQTPASLLALYADLLRKEVEALEKAGVKEIQLDEPAFKAGEPLLDAAVEQINRIFKGIKARRWVACYFHDLSSILPALSKLQVEVLSMDLVTAPKLADRLKEFKWSGEIALGLIDGRNTRMDSAPEVISQIKKVSAVIPLNRLWVSPNCGLEFLPHEAALKKLQILRQVAQGI